MYYLFEVNISNGSIIIILEVKINFKFKKVVGIAIKSKETRQTAITHHPVLPIDITCVWSNTIAAG